MAIRPALRVGRSWGCAAALALLCSGAARDQDLSRYRKALDLREHQVYLGAIVEAQQQLKETPNHAPSWLLIAGTYLDLKTCAEASVAAAAAAKTLGQAAAPDAASQEALQKVLAELDGTCGASLPVAHAYVQAGQYAKAGEIYSRYLAQNPGDAKARLEMARILSWAKEYPASTEQYQILLRAHPNDREVILGQADTYIWSNDLPKAEAQLKRALALRSADAEARVKLGRVYEWQGHYQAATAEYSAAGRLSPDNKDAQEGLERVKGLEAGRLRRTTSADIVKKIQETGNTALYWNLANVLYHNEGRKEEGIRTYRLYLTKFPDDYQARLKLARVLSWEKRYNDSIALYRQCLAQRPDDVVARTELANVLAWQKRFSPALAELDIVKAKNPSLTVAYLSAGDIHRWQGSFPEARSNYRKALELQPDNSRAQDGLREVARLWRTSPTAHFTDGGVWDSDDGFRWLSQDLGAKFYVADGWVDLDPGVKLHEFQQQGQSLNGQEPYINAGGCIHNNWRWYAGVSQLELVGHANRTFGSIGVEASISTRTWVKAGYQSQDAVFETYNLQGLLNGLSINEDVYNVEFTQIVPFYGKNEIRGLLSEAYFSDGNSRSRVYLKAVHEVIDEPHVAVGLAYKASAFSQPSTSLYPYFAPSHYAGPGVTAEMTYFLAQITYRLGMTAFKIMNSPTTEALLEGGASYRRPEGLYAGVYFSYGRGGGGIIATTSNSLVKVANLEIGYNF